MDPVTISIVTSVLVCGSAFLSIVIKVIQLRRLIQQEHSK